MTNTERSDAPESEVSDTEQWPARKVLEVGLRVHERMKQYPWDRIALTIPQAKEVLAALSESAATPKGTNHE